MYKILSDVPTKQTNLSQKNMLAGCGLLDVCGLYSSVRSTGLCGLQVCKVNCHRHTSTRYNICHYNFSYFRIFQSLFSFKKFTNSLTLVIMYIFFLSQKYVVTGEMYRKITRAAWHHHKRTHMYGYHWTMHTHVRVGLIGHVKRVASLIMHIWLVWDDPCHLCRALS